MDRFSPPFPPANQSGSLHFPVSKCWLTTNCPRLFVDALRLQAALKQTLSPVAGWNKHSGQRWKVIRSQSVLLTTVNPLRKPEAQHLYPLVMKPLRSSIPQKNHGFLSLFPFPLDQEFNLPLTSPPCVPFGSFNMGLKAAAWPKSWAKYRFIESQHHPSSINRSDSRQWIHKSLSTGHEQGILGDSGLKGQKFSCLMKWPSASGLAFC